MSDTKSTCPHCKKEIADGATRCPHCHADLRNWVRRHPVIGGALVVIVLLFVLGSIGNALPHSETGQEYQQRMMAANDPTIKVLGTLPTNYIGKTLNLNVYAQTDRYYNYGFDDENSWYSLKIWDDTATGVFDSVYAYVPKTEANKALIDQALDHPVFISITATIPANKWEDNSNAYLEITSWHY